MVRKGSAKVMPSDVGAWASVPGTTASIVLSGLTTLRPDLRGSLLGHLSCRWRPTDARTAMLRRVGQELPRPCRARDSIGRPASTRRGRRRGA